MPKRKIFTKKQEQQICNEYFSEKRPSTVVLGKKWKCDLVTINNIIKRNGYNLRTISEAKKGTFCGENHPMFGKHHSLKSIRKIKESLKGKIPWNKGLKTGPFSKEHKRKIGEALKKNHPMRGRHLSEKTKQRIRETILQYIQNHCGPFKNTKPELKMKDILNELDIPFEHQFRVGSCLFDFYLLNTNILIEADGDYFHGNPKKFSTLNKMQLEMKKRDNKHNEIAKDNNFILLRFWESDILNNVEYVKMRIFKVKERNAK